MIKMIKVEIKDDTLIDLFVMLGKVLKNEGIIKLVNDYFKTRPMMNLEDIISKTKGDFAK